MPQALHPMAELRPRSPLAPTGVRASPLLLTLLRAGSSILIGLIDVIPEEFAYANRDFYMVSLLLWCAYGFYAGRYALWGNKITARTLARRGYVCPMAKLARAAWSIAGSSSTDVGAQKI